MTKPNEPPQTPPQFPGYPVPLIYQPQEPIDWSWYWRIIVDQRKLIAAVTVASTLIATAIALLITPTYRAEVLLAPVERDSAQGLSALAGQFGDLASLTGLNLGSRKDKTAEYVAALKSRALSVAFIKENKLMPVLFADKWDTANKHWNDSSNAPTEWKAYEKWDENIRRVAQDRRTGLVTLAIEWKDPALAAQWANELVKEVNTRLRLEAVKEADQSISYLEKQLPQTNSVEVQQAIYRLIEGQTKEKMIASTREEYAFTTIDPAVTPEKKHRPRRAAIVLAGLLLGLITAVGVVLVIDRVRPHKESTTR
jgi:uncharacterized protein involved in exopolysaccharide biosynthesis